MNACVDLEFDLTQVQYLDTVLVHEFLDDYREGKALGFLEPLGALLDGHMADLSVDQFEGLEAAFDSAPEFGPGSDVKEIWAQLAPHIEVTKAAVSELYLNARNPVDRAVSLCLMGLYA